MKKSHGKMRINTLYLFSALMLPACVAAAPIKTNDNQTNPINEKRLTSPCPRHKPSSASRPLEPEKIADWLAIGEAFHLESYQQITLCDATQALIAGYSSELDTGSVQLTIPESGETSDLGAARDYAVTSLAGPNDASIIIIDGFHSMGGTTEGRKSLIQLDGTTELTLHAQDYHDNFGNCGEGMDRCAGVSVDWVVGKDAQGPLLIETITESHGADPEQLKSRKRINHYRYSVRAAP